MFCQFYNLNGQPFRKTPDPKYLYMGTSQRETLASLQYGIASNRSFLTLVAAPGMGKTTLLFRLMDQLKNTEYRTAFLSQFRCSQHEFLRCLVAELNNNSAGQDCMTLQLHNIMMQLEREGKRLVLIVDEAHSLDNDVLETIRLLPNFQKPDQKLLQIIMAGQSLLNARLSSPELLQFQQRVSIMTHLQALSPSEVREYIGWQLRVAGHVGRQIFTSDAMTMIAGYSAGTPRLINKICLNSLTKGFALQKREIDGTIVQEVVSALTLKESAPSSVSPEKKHRRRFRIVLKLKTPSPWPVSPKEKRRRQLRIAAGIGLVIIAGSIVFL